MSPNSNAQNVPEPLPSTAEAMVARCRPAVERMAAKFAPRHIREDLVQDALLRVAVNFRRCRTNPEAWARSIVLNLLRHDHRDERRENRFLAEERRKDGTTTDPRKSELMALVDRAFFDLSPLQQEALRILVVDEIPEQEAAKRMGVSWGSYRALIHRARRSLAKKLRPLLGKGAFIGELSAFGGEAS